MSSTLYRFVFLFLVLSTGVGCAMGSDPSERALRRSLEATSTAVDRGVRAAEAMEDVPLVGRFNPCRCPAPDFEIYARGRWQRIIVDGDEAIIDDLIEQARAAEEQGRLASLRLWGRLDGSADYAETAIEYPRFRVDRFEIE